MSRFNPLKLSSKQLATLQNMQSGVCWKGTYTRGAGAAVSYCNETSSDKGGALCYPKCEEPGYVGIGPR